MTLSSQACDWVRRIGGVPVTAAVPLPGASSSSVYRLTMREGPDLVIKQFDRDDPLDRRPDRAAHEAAVLELLATSEIPVPRLVGSDPVGEDSGAPAVLMAHVTGSTAMPGDWLAPAAALTAALAGVAPGDLDWRYARYNEGVEPLVPSWAADPGLWKSAFDVIDSDPPAHGWGFIHRDLHPGNLIWRGDRIAAVIDWLSGCIGPRAVDGAHFRANLAMDLGHEAADDFLAGYLRRVPEGTWHPFWAVVDAIDFLPFWQGQDAVDGWRWDDRPNALTGGSFEQYLRSSLTALGV